MPLQAPPRDFASLPLTVAPVPASRLFRISRFPTGEPFFGRSGGNRFDDPLPAKRRRYGTCYAGFDLETAIAETVLHDDMPVGGRFAVSYADFAARWLVRFKGETLQLANLTGPSLKALGGDGELSTIVPYALPQRWSQAVHRHPQQVDGILYVSRHVNDRMAVVVFERAQHRLGTASTTPLVKARGVLAAVAELRIAFDYP